MDGMGMIGAYWSVGDFAEDFSSTNKNTKVLAWLPWDGNKIPSCN